MFDSLVDRLLIPHTYALHPDRRERRGLEADQIMQLPCQRVGRTQCPPRGRGGPYGLWWKRCATDCESGKAQGEPDLRRPALIPAIFGRARDYDRANPLKYLNLLLRRTAVEIVG